MSESRRLDNARLKRELRLRLRYPTVREGPGCRPDDLTPLAVSVGAGRRAAGRASSGSSGSRRPCRPGGRSAPRRRRPSGPAAVPAPPKTMTKVRAFIGIGGNSGMITRLGNSMPKASSSAYRAPEAPTVGTREPVNAGDEQLRHRRRQHAGQQELPVAPLAPQPLEFGAEHPQPQHVEEQVPDAAVQEGVGDQLPGHEVAAAQRPQRKGAGAGRRAAARRRSPCRRASRLGSGAGSAASSRCRVRGWFSPGWCPRPDSNWHALRRRILSPLRLPISSRGQGAPEGAEERRIITRALAGGGACSADAALRQ